MARLVAIGVVAGIFSSLFGVGGGIVVVPLLILALHWERSATATSLAAILVTALAGVLVFAWHGEVQPAEAALVGIPGAVGAFVGTTVQQRLTNRTLAVGFALLLTVLGVTLLAG